MDQEKKNWDARYNAIGLHIQQSAGLKCTPLIDPDAWHRLLSDEDVKFVTSRTWKKGDYQGRPLHMVEDADTPKSSFRAPPTLNLPPTAYALCATCLTDKDRHSQIFSNSESPEDALWRTVILHRIVSILKPASPAKYDGHVSVYIEDKRELMLSGRGSEMCCQMRGDWTWDTAMRVKEAFDRVIMFDLQLGFPLDGLSVLYT